MNYTVTFSDGTRWSVPVMVIAVVRATHYRHKYGGDIGRSLREDTLPLFESDPFAIQDWAQNDMNWEDVYGSATRLRGPTPDYQNDWANPSSVEIVK